MPILHKPQYPVVDPNPSLERAIRNFSIFDVAVVAASSYSGYLVGYFGGKQFG
jgi:hypothetical protein